MKEIQFKLEDWGILTMGVVWTNIYCPYCKEYNSNSFLFDLEMNRTEYTGKCKHCHRELKIKISEKENNALFKGVEKRYREAIAGKNTPLTNFMGN